MTGHVNSDDIKSLLDSAQDFEAKNNIEQAIACYERVIQLDPNHFFSYLQLGKIYKQTNRIIDSILAFQKAIEIKSEQPFWVYEALGNALSYQNRFDEAIFAYEKTISLKQELPPRIYINLGNALIKEKRLQEAILCYQNAIKLNPGNTEHLYLCISHVYFQLNQTEKAIENYKNWIEKRYLINHQHKIIYCPIPKNASSFLKLFMVENSNQKMRYAQLNEDIHRFVRRSGTDPLLEKDSPLLQDFSYLNHEEYFKFAILRNPLDRLVSAYLNKFVKTHPNPPNFAQHVIKDVHLSLDMNPDIKRSINFSQFIHYLASSDDFSLDYHWYPQYLFLGLDLFKFDYIGQFERMDLVFQQLEKKFAIKIDSQKRGPVNTYASIENGEKLHEKYPEELSHLNGFPKAPQLYTPELEELVRVRYAKDIEIYESEFNVRL